MIECLVYGGNETIGAAKLGGCGHGWLYLCAYIWRVLWSRCRMDDWRQTRQRPPRQHLLEGFRHICHDWYPVPVDVLAVFQWCTCIRITAASCCGQYCSFVV